MRSGFRGSIRVVFKDERTAESVRRALIAETRSQPEGSMSVERRGREVRIAFEAPKISTLRAMLSSHARAVHMLARILGGAKRGRERVNRG